MSLSILARIGLQKWPPAAISKTNSKRLRIELNFLFFELNLFPVYPPHIHNIQCFTYIIETIKKSYKRINWGSQCSLISCLPTGPINNMYSFESVSPSKHPATQITQRKKRYKNKLVGIPFVIIIPSQNNRPDYWWGKNIS